MVKPKGSIDTRQYVAAFVTQCTLSLNDEEGSWAGLCQCDSFVMFCAQNTQIMTEVSEKSYNPKIRFVFESPPKYNPTSVVVTKRFKLFRGRP